MKKMEAALIIADLIRKSSVFDCNIIICDTEAKILQHIQADTFTLKTEIGDIASGGAVKKALSEKKQSKTTIPENVYGVRIKASVIPVIEDDGQLSGAIGTAVSLKTQDDLLASAHSIASTSEQINATSGELSASAMVLANSLVNAKNAIEKVIGEIEKTDAILQFVDDIADSSNLLGLNAAIEASRAGEHGMGFRVIADKIRDMAEKSSVSVNNIRNIIKTIQDDTGGLLEMILKVSDLGQQQAASTEEIESAMQSLANSAGNVESIAEVI